MINVINNLAEFLAYRKQYSYSKQSIGFVPTMGALHAGHRSLLKRCRQENDIAILSIFVNPHQFNNPNDLNAYPQNTAADLLIATDEKIDCVLLPKADDIYFDHYRYQIREQAFSLLLEGQHRVGHFEGVMTVVMKLLHLVQPQNIYFGEKDYQQYQLIKEMAAAFFLDTNVIACPTVREKDGLAMSSRNQLLTQEQRKLASAFPAILLNTALTIEEAKNQLHEKGLKVDYIEDYQGRRFGAVYCENIRLIDNITL